MSLQTWLLYVAAVFVLTITPGPSVLMCVTNSVKYGVRRAAASALGSITSGCIIIAVVGIGFGAVLAASEKFFQVVKWIGVAYLIYIGIKSFLSKDSSFEVSGDSATGTKSLRDLYLNGFLIGITNPKGLLFFSAFLPQFVNPQAPQLPQFLILGATFVFFETMWLMTYASFAARVAPWLRAPGRAKVFNRVTGITFVGAGALLATVKRT